MTLGRPRHIISTGMQLSQPAGCRPSNTSSTSTSTSNASTSTRAARRPLPRRHRTLLGRPEWRRPRACGCRLWLRLLPSRRARCAMERFKSGICETESKACKTKSVRMDTFLMYVARVRLHATDISGTMTMLAASAVEFRLIDSFASARGPNSRRRQDHCVE